jgi:hypothetical protein
MPASLALGRHRLARVGAMTRHAEPSAPSGNGAVESLDGQVWHRLPEAKVVAAHRRRQCGRARSHSSLSDGQPAPDTILPRQLSPGSVPRHVAGLSS